MKTLKTILTVTALTLVTSAAFAKTEVTNCKLDLDNFPGFEEIVQVKAGGKSKEVKLVYEDKTLATAEIAVNKISDTSVDLQIYFTRTEGSSVKINSAQLTPGHGFQANLGNAFLTCQLGKFKPRNERNQVGE